MFFMGADFSENFADCGKGMVMMKVLKGISLFVVYPLLFLGLGIYVGVKASHFFYPGEQSGLGQNMEQSRWGESLDAGGNRENPVPESGETGNSGPVQLAEETGSAQDQDGSGADSVEAAAAEMTLCVDTEYVLEETDILNHSVVETSWRLPEMYVGMNREQFLQSMETYEISPPLSELERGFVSLEVLAFSRERVVVRKNYRFLQPSASFYLAVYDNEVIVYLEDKQTVYIETHIELESLPEELQQNIMEMMWIEDEEKLYNFLENYSS